MVGAQRGARPAGRARVGAPLASLVAFAFVSFSPFLLWSRCCADNIRINFTEDRLQEFLIRSVLGDEKEKKHKDNDNKLDQPDGDVRGMRDGWMDAARQESATDATGLPT